MSPLDVILTLSVLAVPAMGLYYEVQGRRGRK